MIDSSSIEIIENADLQPFNTMAVPGRAEYFCRVDNQRQLLQALDYANHRQLPVTALGGGSNLLLAADIAGLVVHLNLTGIHAAEIAPGQFHVSFAAGENWHQAVEHCLQQGWYGLENLSLIPGNMGAAPIQNIGAYGVELCDLFISLEAIEISSGELVVMDKQACQFGYRDSIFKQAGKGRYLITLVTLALSSEPQLNIQYPALAEALQGTEPSPQQVSAAVCRIRREKLPDPQDIPNAGSFFKNPVIEAEMLHRLLESNASMPYFQQPNNRAKVPAAWLIDQCGFRGLRSGNVGVHQHQALVLVNFGGTGAEILHLARQIQQAVQERFMIALEIEPQIYGLSEQPG